MKTTHECFIYHYQNCLECISCSNDTEGRQQRDTERII